jgi:hypothetical protein
MITKLEDLSLGPVAAVMDVLLARPMGGCVQLLPGALPCSPRCGEQQLHHAVTQPLHANGVPTARLGVSAAARAAQRYPGSRTVFIPSLPC